MSTTSAQNPIKNHYHFSEYLENKFLDGKVSEKVFACGAIGQIDLVGSTAFTVSKTTVRETLEKESEIFETNLTGNKLDFEDEMLLTRNDLIKRDIVYNIKSIAYNGILVGRLRIIAKWLDLQTLGTEGDKIIVFGENEKNILTFCLIATKIFKKKSKKGHQGFGYRCGISKVDEKNILSIFENSKKEFLTASGKCLVEAEKMEANAKNNCINIQKELVETFSNEFAIKKNHEGFFCLDETKILPGEVKEKINILLKDFESLDIETSSSSGNFSITKRTPIAFVKLEIDEELQYFLPKFINDMKENNILLLRFGVVKEGKVNLICQPNFTRKPSYSMLRGFQKLIEKGYQIKVGLTFNFLWIGNITQSKIVEPSYDVMGQSINLAARIVYKTETNEKNVILVSDSFLESLKAEGYNFSKENLDSIEFLAKGFDQPMYAFLVNQIQLDEKESLKLFHKGRNFSEIIVDISSRISNILFSQTKNYYFAINAANFLVSKLILFSGLNKESSNEQVLEMQRHDFYSLAKVALANLSAGIGIIDTFENIIAKIPDLESPDFLLNNLDEEIIEDLTKLALITFGRVYDFKVATLKNALNFDSDKIFRYEDLGFLWINKRRTFARLQPPLAYVLDLRAGDTQRLSLHKIITFHLWKNLKKEPKNSRTWYEKGRVLALHARFTEANHLPQKLKNLLIEIFEYAIKERELLDLLIFENSLLDKISSNAKKDLFYELALVNLKFEDTPKAFDILTSIKKFRKTAVLTQKVNFFLDICDFKLKVTLDPEQDQKRLLQNEKIWQLMSDEEIEIAEKYLEV